MTCFVGLDVSQKMTAICVVDNAGRRLWRGQCPTVPAQISVLVRRHAGDDARIGIENVKVADLHRAYWPNKQLDSPIYDHYSICTLQAIEQ